MFYIQYSLTAQAFGTHIHTYGNLTRTWRANIYVYRIAAEATFMWSTVRFFLQNKDRCFMAGTITLFTFSTATSLILNLYTTKWENKFDEGGVFIPQAFLICLPFITSSPQPEITEINCQFFSSPCRSKILGFGWRETRFHLLGRSVHPMDAFETSPYVLCQSQSPSWHITQTVIHNLSFFICQRVWWKICYPNLTHK